MTTKDLTSKGLATHYPTDKPLCGENRRHGLALVFLANGAGVLLALAVAAILRF
ncbi:MAG: hypothetical protein J0H01_24490 [Rhizobiales bacterium]|nr:hypothetical protein [Hyphomicrobiales bacterium]